MDLSIFSLIINKQIYGYGMVSLFQSGYHNNTNLTSLWKLLLVTDRKPEKKIKSGNEM